MYMYSRSFKEIKIYQKKASVNRLLVSSNILAIYIYTFICIHTIFIYIYTCTYIWSSANSNSSSFLNITKHHFNHLHDCSLHVFQLCHETQVLFPTPFPRAQTWQIFATICYLTLLREKHVEKHQRTNSVHQNQMEMILSWKWLRIFPVHKQTGKFPSNFRVILFP